MMLEAWFILKDLLQPLIDIQAQDEHRETTENNLSADDIQQAQEEFVVCLQDCEQSLEEIVATPELERIKQALVICADELIQSRFLNGRPTAEVILLLSQLQPLQQKFYGFLIGGEYFFNHLDGLLAEPGAMPLALEVYYFCMKLGFKGRWADNQAKIGRYLFDCERCLVASDNTVQRNELFLNTDEIPLLNEVSEESEYV